MSIYIRGMEIPSCEVGCRAYMDFRIWNDGTIEARIGPKETEYKAVPVPPHGRLGDLDALKLTHCKECTLYPDKCLEKTEDGCDWESVFHINLAPTVIQADGIDSV